MVLFLLSPTYSDASVEASDSSRRNLASNSTAQTSSNANSGSKSTEADATTTASPAHSPRSEGEIYFEARHFDFQYKCTNVSLSVTDLMFSLTLHTTNQAKRDVISRILEPYATNDVMELSKTRNWEFFPASASTTVPSTGESDTASSPAASSAPSVSSTSPQEVDPSTSTPLSSRDSQTATIVQGVKEYENGDRYEGGMLRGIREGHGKYYSKSKSTIYEGGYKDGKRHGHGKYTFPTGASVAGTFQRGILVQGEYCYPNGDVYIGDFKDDKFDGQGEWRCAHAIQAAQSSNSATETPQGNPDSVKLTSNAIDIYKGAWKAGQRHGVGEATLRCGDTYTGEFLNDAIHGFGKYHFSNGDLYNGQFAQGLINGVGEYTFAASGKVLLGEFANGKLIKSSAITNPSEIRKSKPFGHDGQSSANTTSETTAGINSETEALPTIARTSDSIPEDTEPTS